MRCGQNQEQMNVVCGSASGDQRKTFVASDSAQVGIEFADSRWLDERSAVFGAEDAMNEIIRICMRHLVVPSLRDSILQGFAVPTLKRGANERCAYGAIDVRRASIPA